LIVRNQLQLHIAIMNDRGFTLTMQAVRRQLAAMPCRYYQIRLIHHQTRLALPGQRLWTDAELLDRSTIGFLRASNRQGYDIYLHPDGWDQNAGYILVDLDWADDGVIERMRWNGHHPCLVVETSPGHLQAWIQVSHSCLEAGIATSIAKQLASDYGGDPGSADWRHLGRLAGFTNQKPIRRSQRGYAPWVKIVHACAGLAPHGPDLVEAAQKTWQPGLSQTSGDRPAALTLTSITAAEANAIYQDCATKWRIAERFRPVDWSRVDLWVARHLLLQGLRAWQVEEILQLASPQFPRKHGDPLDYLRRTVARAAFSPLGEAV
jgi:hypothetical protein